MSVTVTKDKEGTVVTIKSDNKNMFPPLCQVLGALCYSPVCCSVHKGLMNPCVTAVLGTVQIMTGLFNIALGPGRPFLHPRDVTVLGASYWLGAVYAAVGVMSILAGQFPSRCLVGFTVFMNIVGTVFALTGMVMYGTELQAFTFNWEWSRHIYSSSRSNYSFQRLLIKSDIVSVVLAVLQLFLCIGFIALGIRALRRKKEEDGKDVEDQQPVLKENLLTSPCA